METKKQVYVHVKNEQIKSDVIEILTKHDQLIMSPMPIFSDYKDYPYLKYYSEENCWVLSDYHNGGIAEISVEQLDEILSFEKTGFKPKKSSVDNIWLKDPEYPHWLMCFDYKNKAYYGRNVNGNWHYKRVDYVREKHSYEEEATYKEVSCMLIEEAFIRGLKKGKSIISPDNVDYGHNIKSEKFSFSFDTNTLFVEESGVNIFHDGKWASIKQIEDPKNNSDDLVIEEVSIQERYQKPFTPKLHSELVMKMVNKIVDEKNNSDTKKTILQEAEEIINGSRAEDYGSVTENFTKIAVGWKEIFADGNFTPRRVALAMAWLKICRDVNTPKHDNILDIAGYAGCIGKMDNEANQKL